MADEDAHEAQIDALRRQSDEIQGLMDALLAEMDKMPKDKRRPLAGTFTKRFVDLQRRQSEIAQELIKARSTITRPDSA